MICNHRDQAPPPPKAKTADDSSAIAAAAVAVQSVLLLLLLLLEWYVVSERLTALLPEAAGIDNAQQGEARRGKGWQAIVWQGRAGMALCGQAGWGKRRMSSLGWLVDDGGDDDDAHKDSIQFRSSSGVLMGLKTPIPHLFARPPSATHVG